MRLLPPSARDSLPCLSPASVNLPECESTVRSWSQYEFYSYSDFFYTPFFERFRLVYILRRVFCCDFGQTFNIFLIVWCASANQFSGNSSKVLTTLYWYLREVKVRFKRLKGGASHKYLTQLSWWCGDRLWSYYDGFHAGKYKKCHTDTQSVTIS